MPINKLSSKEKNLFVLAFIIHGITAYFSNGFYHWDEHFQIFEFAQYKLGATDASNLPWEFHSQMRPFLLPALAVFFQSLIGDFFITAGVMRFLAMALSFSACYFFYQKTKNEFNQKYFPTYIFLSFFLWFLPYLHVRVSAEMIGGAFFILGYSLSLKNLKNEKNEKKTFPFLLSGLLFGIGFWVRFQLGFALLGLAVGLLISKKYLLKEILFMFLGFLFAIGINILIDSWGYGEFVFTPWKYLHENIILGKSQDFGVNPVFDYFKWILNKPGFPIGLLIYTATFYQIKNHLKHPLTIASLFFLFAHFFVAHKEIRFLFPLLFILPYFFMNFITKIPLKLFVRKKLAYTFIIINMIPMIYLMNTAAHPSVNFFKEVNKLSPALGELTIKGETDPYRMAGLPVSFYHRKKPHRTSLPGHYVFSDRVQFARENEQKGCLLIYSSNIFLTTFLNNHLIKNKKKLWTLYQCQK